MNTLSFTSTKTLSYDSATSLRAYAIVEKLASFTAAVLQAARKIRPVSTVPTVRAAQA